MLARQEPSDADLLNRSKKGDEAAFVQLYRRHQGAIFRFALHMSGRRDTAEEIVQDIFTALLFEGNSAGYVPDRGPLAAYLLGAARNLLRTQTRQAKRFVDAEEGRETASADEDSFAALSRQEDLRDLRAAILHLPPSYREVIVLCDLEDMDYAQAAAQLSCPVGTVRSRLHRARAILGARLRKRERCSA